LGCAYYIAGANIARKRYLHGFGYPAKHPVDVLIKKGRHVLDAPLFITKDGVTTEHQTMREAMAEQGIDLNKVG